MDKLTGDGGVHQETGSSRSRVTTPRQYRFLVFVSRRNHMSTARALEINFRRAAEVHLPDQTVRNRLNDDCTIARRPARSQVLTEEHRAVRINFAREHHNRHLRHWRPVLFSDDNISTDSTNDRPARVWLRQGERYADCNIVDVDRYDGGSSWP